MNMLINELERHFPNFELMSVMGIVFPRFWIHLNVNSSFSLHLGVIKKHSCETKMFETFIFANYKAFKCQHLGVANVYVQVGYEDVSP